MLQEIFGEIRLVEAGEDLYAEFESPLQRLVLAAGGTLRRRSSCGDSQPYLEVHPNQVAILQRRTSKAQGLEPTPPKGSNRREK